MSLKRWRQWRQWRQVEVEVEVVCMYVVGGKVHTYILGVTGVEMG
jgi:hypothetical protein